MTIRLLGLMVRRYGEDEATPVILDDRRACGMASDHIRHGCIGIELSGHGRSGLVHLTSDEALRLSDLLRAMAETNEGGGR